MKKETLEEAAENYARIHTDTSVFRTTHIRDFIAGAEWQQEGSYSEEEVLDIIYKHTEDLLAGKKVTLNEWFEQFKK